MTIKQLLKEKQIKQEYLAYKLKLSKGQMSNIVSGKSQPNVTQVYMLSKILVVSIDELVHIFINQNKAVKL